MRVVLSAFAVVLAVSACGQAQDLSASGDMPRLSAANMIEACYMDHGPEARREACIGVYAEACIRLSPHGETTLGMVQCTVEEQGAWDGRLNARYAELRPILAHDGVRDALRDAQRAWIALRDADCAFEPLVFEGGSLARLIAANCMLTATAERTLVLEEWIRMYSEP